MVWYLAPPWKAPRSLRAIWEEERVACTSTSQQLRKLGEGNLVLLKVSVFFVFFFFFLSCFMVFFLGFKPIGFAYFWCFFLGFTKIGLFFFSRASGRKANPQAQHVIPQPPPELWSPPGVALEPLQRRCFIRYMIAFGGISPAAPWFRKAEWTGILLAFSAWFLSE